MKVRAYVVVFALAALSVWALAVEPAPVVTLPALETVAPQEPAAQEPCVQQEASAAIESSTALVPPANAGGPVGVCLNTWCQDIGVRCSNPVWQNRGKCCTYTCVPDASCTTKQPPPATACDLE